MTIGAVLAAIASLGAIVTGLVYVFKYTAWSFTKSEAQKKEEIDRKVDKEERQEKDTGRPA